MALPPIVALEIGTSKVTALVGELRDDGHVVITGIGEHASSGVRKGEVVDFENAVVCVRSVLSMAEESAKVSISQVHLAVSGGHIRSMVNKGSVPVLSRGGAITHEDVNEVMEVACAVNLPADRRVLHTICRHFSIDDQEQVVKPEGMVGARLSLEMLVLHGIRTRLNNILRVVTGVPMEVQDVAFSGLCSALAVLSPEQKKSGVVVIDLGGGTTDYLGYAGNVVAAAGVLALGGDHVTNDIALAFKIPIGRAEAVKREHGSALVAGEEESRAITLPPEVGFSGRHVEVRDLRRVINARADEILCLVRKRLEEEGMLHRLGAGVVLTGGGARLAGIAGLAEQVFGMPCVVGTPVNVSGITSVMQGPEYATCSGLALYGFRTQESGGPAPTKLSGLIKSLFGR